MISKEDIEEFKFKIIKIRKKNTELISNSLTPLSEQEILLETNSIIDSSLKYIEQLETKSNNLENKLSQLNTYILINGIDDTLITATQIKVENQQYYLHQKEVERLKNIIEQLNTVRSEMFFKLLKDKEALIEHLKYNATKREAEIQLKLIDKYLKIMKGENNE